MVTKRSAHKKQHVSTTSTHILLKKGIFIYSLLVFIIFALIVFVSGSVLMGKEYQTNQARKQRILDIYSSLNLGEDYRTDKIDVFGDKRPYGSEDWNKGRTFSSSMTYGHQASASETFSDLKQRIETAGFTQITGPDYGSTAPARQDHYKNDRGEYIRVSVAPKAWHDALVYGTALPAPQSPEMTETGPVYVTIKVNLDDNNE